jgi:hypothetical protein
MTSKANRLNATSDKYWLQTIANNTAVSGGENIQKLTPISTQASLQSVGIFGANSSNQWEAIATTSGKLQVDATITNEPTSKLNVVVENDSLLGDGQVLFDSVAWTTIKADSTGTFSKDANDRQGAYYTNTNAGNKMNIYYFDGTQETMTVGQLSSIYSTIYIDNIANNNLVPFFVVYTKPTGVGDAGPFYHSRKIWTYSGANTDKIGVGERIILCAENTPSKFFSERKVLLETSTIDGDWADTEEILLCSIHTDSSATAGAVSVCISSLGYNSIDGGFIRDTNIVQPDASQTGLATSALQTSGNDTLTNIQTSTALTEISTANIAVYTQNLNDRISKGEDATIASGSGGLQQILCYGRDNQGDLEPINIDNNGHLKITINDVDETNTGLKIAGETQLGAQVNLRVGNTGNLRTHETLERLNTTQTILIPRTQTVNSAGIDMSDYQYLAVFGDTDNTTNTEIFFEYSTDNITYYRGAGDNSKIVIVGATGNFYASERVITRWVRISRTNTSGANETMTVNFTRA